MRKPKITESEPQWCPIRSAIDLIGGKWKLPILYHLRDKTLRFSDLRRLLPAVTQKMLTQQLRNMEHDGLISRTVYPEVPPRVEYNITPIAKKLAPVLASMCAWSMEYHSTRLGAGKVDFSNAMCSAADLGQE